MYLGSDSSEKILQRITVSSTSLGETLDKAGAWGVGGGGVLLLTCAPIVLWETRRCDPLLGS